MQVVAFIFWVLLAIVFYAYIGYGILVALFTLFRNKKIKQQDQLPEITVVIAAHNEAEILEKKIENSLSLNYPSDKLFVLIILDGCSDRSEEIIKGIPKIKYLLQYPRQGKAAALNRAMENVTTEIVVFTDANTFLNSDSLVNVAAHFSDPRTGAVAGEKKIADHTGLGDAEGLYWKYESLMKKLDARFYSAIGATGELLAMRSSLYEPLKQEVILDDLTLSMSILMKGYSIAYEPRAFAIELPSMYLRDEEKRKIRISAGAFQFLELMDYKKLFANTKLTFQFISRRWLRWCFCPPALIIIFILNILLWQFHDAVIYTVLFYCQLAFYVAAVTGWIMMRKGSSFPLFTVPFYFIFMNFCMLRGWFYYRDKKISVLWEKASR